jgi:hypothetical protein
MQAQPINPQQNVATPKETGTDRAYVTTGVVSFEEESEPAAPSPPKATAPPVTPAVPSPPKPTAAPVGPEPMAATPAELQQRVLRVCAGAARDVRVTIRADRHWEVKVKVSTPEVANDVSIKILQQLADMAQPHVHLAVEVTP